ncbi:MAG TPA: hypothetical protein VFP39_01930 [Gemmatimonadales bacterium]|nr:hypothetical protein [Gemmatimonadales bacterium]
MATCTENRTPTSVGGPGPDAPTGQVVSGITQTLLSVGNNTVNQKIYTTASIAPAANALITVAVLGHNSTAAPPSPAVTGGGMTSWTVVASVVFDGVATPHKRLTVYQAQSAAPGSGPVTITWTSSVSNCQWIVMQWNGATGIVQSGSTQADAATRLTVNLAAFGNSNDVAYGVFGVAKAAPAVTPGSGFTLNAEQGSLESPAADLASESATNLASVAATWGSANGGAIALEIAAGQSGPPPTTSTLSLTVSGTGSVSFAPAFQSGGTCTNPATTSCSAVYLTTDNVTLTATAPTGWSFSGWSGACSGTGTCPLAMSANRSVTATFAQSAPTTHVLTLSIVGTGQAAFSVTPQPGGTCANPATASCTAVFLATDNVALTPGAGFTGWSGDCSGTGTCSLAMSADHAVTVTFSSGGGGGGTITQTVLASGNNPVNQRIYTTASIAPAPNTLITVAVLGHSSSAAPATPALAGGGMAAWTVVSSIVFDGVSTPHKRLTVYRALAAAPGSGPLTITFASSVSNCQWIVVQWTGVDPSGINGAGAIAQAGSRTGDAATGLTVNLAAFGNVNDVAFGVFGIAKNTALVAPGAGFTELAEQPSAEGTQADLEAESQTNSSAINATWTTANGGALGFEIKAGASGPPPPFDLTIDHIYVTQSAQTLNDSEALIAGRPALVRVFVRATQSSAAIPSVRINFSSGGTLLSSTTVAGTGPAPIAPSEGTLSSTWNLSVAGNLVQPGVSITAEVDPDHLITEGNESNNTLALAEVVRSTAPQSYRFVPIKQTGNQLTGNVTVANVSTYGDTAYRLFPITQPTLDVHQTYTTSTNVDDGTDASWTQILSEIDALRVAEHSPATYVGVVRITYPSGIVGIGYIGRPTAVVYDDQTWRGVTVAHELGHTYNRQHSPGCGAGSPDKNYPYAGGIDGIYGTDVFSSPTLLYAPTIHDIMGYCDDNWISDYTYNGILNYIATSNLMAPAQPAQRSMLVWGSIVNGVPHLEPSFVLTAQPVAPSSAGAYQVQGLDKDGVVLFTQGFQPTVVADLRNGEAGTFAFAVPLSDLVQTRLVSLRLVGGGRQVIQPIARGPQGYAVQSWQGNRATITWDTAAAPIVMVRDPASGQILSIGRGGRVEVETRGADLDLLLSNGVAGTVQRLKPLR